MERRRDWSCKGPHVEHWLNGVKIVEYEMWSPDWEARVKASKFGKIPLYGTAKRGHIALQDHGNPSWYPEHQDQSRCQTASEQPVRGPTCTGLRRCCQRLHPRRYSRFRRSFALREFVILMFAPS